MVAARGRIGRHRRSTAIGAAKAVEACDKEPTRVECLSVADERAPPVGNVCTAREGVAHNHGIVAGRIEAPPGLVGHRDVFERDAGLKGELGDDGEALARDQAEEWVFGLLSAGLCCTC